MVDAIVLTPDDVAPVRADWLGRIDYREAHALQRRLAAERADGAIGDRLLLLEHPAGPDPGRNSDPAHILATAGELDDAASRSIRVERGGEVTYHGPGQLVAYPIVAPRTSAALLLRPFVRALEAALVATCAAPRRRRRPSRRPSRLLGATPTGPRRARSARSACASSGA